MKKFRRILFPGLFIMMALAIHVSSYAASPADAAKKAYDIFVSRWPENYTFGLVDINNDKVPELVLAEGDQGWIYNYAGGKVKVIKEYNDTGNGMTFSYDRLPAFTLFKKWQYYYYPAHKALVSYANWDGKDKECYIYMKYVGSTLISVFEQYDKNYALMNGKSLTKAEFNKRRNSLIGNEAPKKLITSLLPNTAWNRKKILSTPHNDDLKYTRITAASNQREGVKLVWNKSANAQGYNIYRMITNYSWKKIATVKGVNTTTYVDKTAENGKLYTYTVRAYKGSTLSSYDKAGKIIVRLRTPGIGKYENNAAAKVFLAWDRNGGASGYDLQYSTDKTFLQHSSCNINSWKTNTKTVGGMLKWLKMYFRIRSYKTIDGTRFYSSWSSVKEVVIKK